MPNGFHNDSLAQLGSAFKALVLSVPWVKNGMREKITDVEKRGRG